MLALYVIIVWMWAVGWALISMFVDELVPELRGRWTLAALCALWPITFPTMLAWYVARKNLEG